MDYDSFVNFYRGLPIGGKGSTEFVVKGYHKEVPKELIHELKAICQVMYLEIFERFGFTWNAIISSYYDLCSLEGSLTHFSFPKSIVR